MALRMIEMVLPQEKADKVEALIHNQKVIECHQISLSDDKVLVRILLSAEMCEKVLEIISKQHPDKEHHIVVFPIQAIVPAEDLEEEEEEKKSSERIAREELYESIKDSAKCSNVYLLMIALSTIVASIGLVRSNVAIIIGAMVIAPMLGPNMALALATTLGDLRLLLRAVLTALAGYSLAIAMSICFGVILHEFPVSALLTSHTAISLGDMAVALASGCAASLALTSGLSAILIGVMVAVSLLPPLVTFGLLVGAQDPHLALGALCLFCINLICINLAAVITFTFQGIYPAKWYEKDKAHKARVTATILWTCLFLIWVGLLLWNGPIIF